MTKQKYKSSSAVYAGIEPLAPAIFGVTIALLSIMGSSYLMSYAPKQIASGTATEIFRSLIEVDGALFGFMGIIIVFILQGLSKKKRYEILLYVFTDLFIFIGSIIASLFGLMNVSSTLVSSQVFVLPLSFLLAGIIVLIYTTFKASI